jgi:hypothetical protein
MRPAAMSCARRRTGTIIEVDLYARSATEWCMHIRVCQTWPASPRRFGDLTDCSVADLAGQSRNIAWATCLSLVDNALILSLACAVGADREDAARLHRLIQRADSGLLPRVIAEPDGANERPSPAP